MWWRRVDDLPVTVATWRATLRRTARREHLIIRTFLIPPTRDEADPSTQLVHAVWINPARGRACGHGSRHGPSVPTQRQRRKAVLRVSPVSDPTHTPPPDRTRVPITYPDPTELPGLLATGLLATGIGAR